MTKGEWITVFREAGERIFENLEKSRKDKNYRAMEVNRGIGLYRAELIKGVKERAITDSWDTAILLNEILLLTYASYIAMLEYRNKVWSYDYMTFSRRIGEMWEPFCKLPFEYPVRTLHIFKPPVFNDVQEKIKNSAIEYIDALDLDKDTKEELKKRYSIPWTMVDSGGIKLELDLHFEQDGIRYNCDFKSGFSSNEKGNTNRLLLVGSIYNSLGKNDKTLLFVRQKEFENNHYLLTLKNSPYWEVYCADDGYMAMKRFTGFDMRRWLDSNADWYGDMRVDLRRYLTANDLLKYLTW